MFRFSLQRMLVMVTLCAILFALVGFVLHITVSSVFIEGEKQVVFQSSQAAPRGTFFELVQGDRTIIEKRMISLRPILVTDIDSVPFDPTDNVMAYYYQPDDPDMMDMLLLVELDRDAYAIYWGGNRADKCRKRSWKDWDRYQERFVHFQSIGTNVTNSF